MSNQTESSYFAEGPAAPRPQPASALAVASFTLGILALVSGWFFMGIVFGSGAIVAGKIATREHGNYPMALTGIILGGIGTLAGAIFTTIWFVALLQSGAISTHITKLAGSRAEQSKITTQQISSRKDFAKGEIGHFGVFEVKIQSLVRNFEPEDSSLRARSDKEFILLNISVKNTSDEPKLFNGYGIGVGDERIIGALPAANPEPSFNGGNIDNGETNAGNIVFEVPKNLSEFSFIFKEVVFDIETSTAQVLTYSLEI